MGGATFTDDEDMLIMRPHFAAFIAGKKARINKNMESRLTPWSSARKQCKFLKWSWMRMQSRVIDEYSEPDRILQ